MSTKATGKGAFETRQGIEDKGMHGQGHRIVAHFFSLFSMSSVPFFRHFCSSFVGECMNL